MTEAVSQPDIPSLTEPEWAKPRDKNIPRVFISIIIIIREFKQSTTAGATTAAVTEKVWGEYVSVRSRRSLNFKFSETKYKETRAKEFKTSFIYFLTA